MAELTKRLNFRVTEEEYQVLEEYCSDTARTKNDVVRELIRALKKKKSKS